MLIFSGSACSFHNTSLRSVMFVGSARSHPELAVSAKWNHWLCGTKEQLEKLIPIVLILLSWRMTEVHVNYPYYNMNRLHLKTTADIEIDYFITHHWGLKWRFFVWVGRSRGKKICGDRKANYFCIIFIVVTI